MKRNTRYVVVLVSMVLCYTGIVVAAHLCTPHKVSGAAPATKHAQDAAAHIEICLALAQQKDQPKEAPDVCRCESVGSCTCGDHCPGCGCHDCKCSSLLTYEAAYKRAKKLNKPLIVFVGQAIRPFKDCVMLRQEAFDGIKGNAVVIGTPSTDPTDKRYNRTDLLGTPTDAQIKDVLGGKEAAEINLTIPKTQAIIECVGGK